MTHFELFFKSGCGTCDLFIYLEHNKNKSLSYFKNTYFHPGISSTPRTKYTPEGDLHDAVLWTMCHNFSTNYQAGTVQFHRSSLSLFLIINTF